MVGILLGDHMSQQSRPGQSLGDRLGGLAGRDDLAFAVRAGVRAAHVFDDEQRRRLVIELLAALGADLDPGLATLRAAALGLGQLVDDRAREGDSWASPCGRGGAASSWCQLSPRFGLGGGTALPGSEAAGATGRRRRRGSAAADWGRSVRCAGRRGGAGGGRGDAGARSFSCRCLPEHVEQFEDHLLEDGGIVGQRRRGDRRGARAWWGGRLSLIPS